jgi:cell division protein FtsB
MRTKGTRTARTTRIPRLPFHWSYLLLAAFLVFFSWKYLEKTREVRSLANQEAALQYSNQQVQDDNMRIQQTIARARTMQYVEDAARHNFNYTMPGETLVQPNPIYQRAPVVRRAPPRPATPLPPTWRQWWNSFFG